MNGRRGVAVVCVVVAFVAGLLVGIQWSEPGRDCAAAHAEQPAPVNEHWLKEASSGQRDQLERHLRGLDVAMVEIGYRFNELHFAGEDRNWPYAQYQIEKIELALKLALERRPKRAESARPLLQETIPFVKQAINNAASDNQSEAYQAALERLRTDCMKCHVAEAVPHFTVEFAKTRTAAIEPAHDPD